MKNYVNQVQLWFWSDKTSDKLILIQCFIKKFLSIIYPRLFSLSLPTPHNGMKERAL